MGSVWSVKTDTRKIDLVFTDPDGVEHAFWIHVKRYLTIGEARRSQVAGFGAVRTEQRKDERGRPLTDQASEIQVNWTSQSFARTEVYLADWSLEDDQGKRMKLGRDVIESLSAEVYALIENAITAHIVEMEDEKKARAGSSKPLTMSA